MYYSLIGLLALVLLLITNHDVLLRRRDASAPPAQRIYRWFLIAVILYYVTDMLWGLLEHYALTALLYADTEVYFIAMALGVLAWTQYVVAYLEDKNAFRTFLSAAGMVFFSGVVLLTVINLFFPIMFWFDGEGRYHTAPARNIALLFQIAILLLTSVYALRVAVRSRERRSRHLTIGMFGLVMLTLIAIQYFEPYLPLYAIAYMLGCSLLRSFVVENEKEEYRRGLESALAREQKELQELNTARRLAYTDALTGAKSKLAYVQDEDQIDAAIYAGTAKDLAIVVFDLNGLKKVNDTEGHEAGDRCIVSACRMICDTFPHSSVYRIGGDEFVAVLEGEDYAGREALLARFNRMAEENRAAGGVVVAAGIAQYEPGRDDNTRHVFERADYLMYRRKNALKQSEGTA